MAIIEQPVKLLICSDMRRMCIWGGYNIFVNVFLAKNSSAAFLFWFRCGQSNNKFIRILAKLHHLHYSRKHSVQIPLGCQIGPGLKLPHLVPIVVHPKAIIGKNCTLFQFTTIGQDNKGNAPIIGDNCFIGSGAAIIGKVRIGDNVTIGANAVVVKDVPDNATVVGVPAKVIHYNHPGLYIDNPV